MDLDELQKIAQNFTRELEDAALGKKTSFAFIKNTIPSSPMVKEDEVFQVMVIGGSVFCNAFVKKTPQGVGIVSEDYMPLPMLPTKEVFFKLLTDHLHPETKTLVLNFGYPQEPVFADNRLDAILLMAVKEHGFEGLVGKRIGQEYEKYIKEKRSQELSVSIANDTICLLLSGLTQHTGTDLAAGVVGTGMNFAMFLYDTTLVNLEAGAFDKFTRTPTGIEIDRSSRQPGVNIFEKEISGAFLYQHFNLLLKERNISYPPLKETAQLSVLAEERTDELGDIARELLERSAQLTACAISGIMEFKKSSMTFVMEGGVFWKGYGYKEIVEETVRKLSPDFFASFIHVEYPDVLGAAKLVA